MMTCPRPRSSKAAAEELNCPKQSESSTQRCCNNTRAHGVRSKQVQPSLTEKCGSQRVAAIHNQTLLIQLQFGVMPNQTSRIHDTREPWKVGITVQRAATHTIDGTDNNPALDVWLVFNRASPRQSQVSKSTRTLKSNTMLQRGPCANEACERGSGTGNTGDLCQQ